MDKVDTYDKEQLQAMGWLFDEIETPDGEFITAIANNEDFVAALANNSSFVTDLIPALTRADYPGYLAHSSSLGTDLINDEYFIADLKAKLGLT